MQQKEIKKIAEEVWKYNKRREKEEELERVHFNECYSKAHKLILKEEGFIKFVFLNKGGWDNVSKRAWEIYEKKYGKLKWKGDLK